MLQFRSGYRATTGYTGAGTLACLVGRRVLVVAAALAFFAGAGQARAAIGLSPCPGKSGVECGTVTVPLDRTGATGGTINLHVEVLPAAGTARGVMFLIAGGPGQGSAGSFDLGPGFNRELMQFMFPGYTLVAFDNRGTGQSGLIGCPARCSDSARTVSARALPRTTPARLSRSRTGSRRSRCAAGSSAPTAGRRP